MTKRRTRKKITKRLSCKQAQAIIDDPRNNVQLAKVYGVSQGTISKMRAGNTWKNLKRPEVVKRRYNRKTEQERMKAQWMDQMMNNSY